MNVIRGLFASIPSFKWHELKPILQRSSGFGNYSVNTLLKLTDRVGIDRIPTPNPISIIKPTPHFECADESVRFLKDPSDFLS
jgi:hypothetical protein